MEKYKESTGSVMLTLQSSIIKLKELKSQNQSSCGLIGFLCTRLKRNRHFSCVFLQEEWQQQFGVVLLELLTGKRAMDKNRPATEQNLVKWERNFLKDPHKLDRILDPGLECQYSIEGAKKVAA
ncbi:unnamed protein product [Fraxinus pennsylvanica]|uniref:Uncharacterized protein n=1 Tax=Fraxinus pennsylvanica TaxID=56036 RepID=A0AAD2A1Y3_9LAMI|nr:unnamed protein product [Fraxinus pennsylvanica]